MTEIKIIYNDLGWDICINDRIISFSAISLVFVKRDIKNIFFKKNNKTLEQTLNDRKYQRLKILFGDKYKENYSQNLGDFLKQLKEDGDKNYLCFLNKYGDNKFCEFLIRQNLTDKGIYCFIVDNKIKYIGRCTDNFKKRINQGYGKIHPKNCFIDGQATNCHLNSLINAEKEVRFGIYLMTNQMMEQIKELEKFILESNSFEWNIQTS